MDTLHSRGIPTWPNWAKEAKPGQRVQHTRSGWTGTVTAVVYHGPHSSTSYVKVCWDKTNATGAVVAPAFDLKPVS